MEQVITIDAMGERCPVPVVRTKKALDKAGPGTVLEVHVDHDIAVQNLEKLARSQQCQFESERIGEKEYRVRITAGQGVMKSGMAGSQGRDEPISETDLRMGPVSIRAVASRLENGSMPDIGDQKDEGAAEAAGPGFLVLIGAGTMGQGDDELGKILMKGFLYALSELAYPPDRMIFFNSGVSLTVQGSDSLEDLRAMEARGVRISSCGTCLDFYGLTDRLGVGDVTNMYDIAETVSSAGKVVRV